MRFEFNNLIKTFYEKKIEHLKYETAQELYTKLEKITGGKTKYLYARFILCNYS